jgi:hypothetical protein
MFAKKAPTPTSSSRTYRKELEYLYARRTTLDVLIQSLEEYDRYRGRPATLPVKRKSA